MVGRAERALEVVGAGATLGGVGGGEDVEDGTGRDGPEGMDVAVPRRVEDARGGRGDDLVDGEDGGPNDALLEGLREPGGAG